MDTFHLLFIAWGAVTALLICTMIYRGTLNIHEEDHIALGAGARDPGRRAARHRIPN